jgi:uncharacterized protein (TIGR02757 family)
MDPLKKTLDRYYREYDFSERVLHDPIEFPHRYADSSDIEVVAFISSCFAYGRVELFKSVLEKILSKMGRSPSDFLLHFDIGRARKDFAGIKYRFNENEDILCLFFSLGEILRAHHSLEKVFKQSYSPRDGNIGPGLSGLMKTLQSIDTSEVYGKNIRPPGLLQFFPSPANGSACKRANLFLRWMIRDRDIDFGIWKEIPKNRLIVPLDTHIARISRCLLFTNRRSQDWKMAVEITEALKTLDPVDPVKYDFALCHLGISGVCKGEKGAGCAACVVNLRKQAGSH